jgi:hypothetical protein
MAYHPKSNVSCVLCRKFKTFGRERLKLENWNQNEMGGKMCKNSCAWETKTMKTTNWGPTLKRVLCAWNLGSLGPKLKTGNTIVYGLTHHCDMQINICTNEMYILHTQKVLGHSLVKTLNYIWNWWFILIRTTVHCRFWKIAFKTFSIACFIKCWSIRGSGLVPIHTGTFHLCIC